MPTSMLEIVDLGNGEIVLQREDGEAIVTIQFSEEARMYILDQGLEVAKAMIQAGIQTAARVAEQAEVEIETAAPDSGTRILH